MSGDYISKAAAINKIMENIVHQDSHDVNLHNIGLRKAMSAIDSLPTADVVERPRWVPVTERLPEKRKWVLCRCEANIIEVLRWENNGWYHDPMHVYYPSFVTHWQPLPEPPEDEAPAGSYDLLYEEGGVNTT